MNRYPSTLIRKETSGPRYFGSTKYPPIDFTIEVLLSILLLTLPLKIFILYLCREID